MLDGGDNRNRTDGLLLARQALSQLSYTPMWRVQIRFVRSPFKKLVGSNGLEPSTSRLSGARSNHLSYEPISVAGSLHRPTSLPDISAGGGDEQNRTVDPLLARQVLSQLSYTPILWCAKGEFPLHLFESPFRAFKIKQRFKLALLGHTKLP